MTDHLETLAQRLEEDPFFLACSLRLYAQSEKLDDAQLSDVLGCSRETLVMLRLCRAPGAEAKAFRKDIDQIVTKFGVNRELLAEAVRRGQAIFQLRKTSREQGTLMAARDAEDKADHE